MNMYQCLILVPLLVVGLMPPVFAEQAVDDKKLGLSGSVFEIPEPTAFNYISTDPEHADSTLPVAFTDAPPQISHSIEEVTPITLSDNDCLDCHDDPALLQKIETKYQDEASPMPESHYLDSRRSPDKVGKKLIGARYFCTQCHVPQAEVEPLMGNYFNEE